MLSGNISVITKQKTKNLNERLIQAVNQGDATEVEILIGAGAYIPLNSFSDGSLLHVAAKYGHVEVIKVLVAKGHPLEVKDRIEETPLHVAAANGQKDAVLILLDMGSKIDTVNQRKETPLDSAKMYQHFSTANVIEEKGGKSNNQLIQSSVRKTFTFLGGTLGSVLGMGAGVAATGLGVYLATGALTVYLLAGVFTGPIGWAALAATALIGFSVGALISNAIITPVPSPKESSPTIEKPISVSLHSESTPFRHSGTDSSSVKNKEALPRFCRNGKH